MKRLLTSLIIGVIVLSLGVVAAQDEAPPFLGITFDESDEGALITSVLPGAPADEAGLEAGDIITALNNEDVSADNLAEAVRALNAGDIITLDILRDGEAQELEATLGERPVSSRFELTPMQVMERAYLGVSLEDTDDGVTINFVSDNSPAAEAGLQEGDIITAINETTIEASIDAVNLIRELEPGESVTLNITRDGEAMTVEATLGSITDNRFEFSMRGDAIIYDGQSWRVLGVNEDGALAEAGLQAGDVITAVDGESITPESLGELEGDVTLSVERGDETLDITVPAEALNIFGGFGMMPRLFGDGFREFRGPRGDMPFSFGMGNVRLGVTFTTIDEDVAAEHDLSVTEGALMTEVLPDSPAAEAGLQVDDVIISVNGDVVDAERTLRDRLFAYEPDDTVTLEVLRGDETLNIDVTLTGAVEVADMPFFNMDELPFAFGDDGALRFFFGPDGEFNFDGIPFEEPAPAPNV